MNLNLSFNRNMYVNRRRVLLRRIVHSSMTGGVLLLVCAVVAVMAANRRRAVVEMTLSDGSVRYIGTKEDAPVISVTPYPDRYVVSCECLSVDPVEL